MFVAYLFDLHGFFVSGWTFELGGISGISDLLSGHAHFNTLFCIEAFCFAIKYGFIGFVVVLPCKS